MKHDAVPTTFHSPYMQKVADKLSILKMTPEERDSYYYYLKQVYTDRDELQAAEDKGEQIGIEKKKKNMARKMLAKGMRDEEVSELTGLSIEAIESLKNGNESSVPTITLKF